MAGKKIGLILALDGEKEFIQAVQTAKKESKLFETQLKGLADQYDGNANSLEHLQKKQELLIQQQAAYKRQLEASKSGLEKANSNYREQGKRLEELKKQLEEARNAQKQMEVAGETGSKAYDEQSKSVEKLEKAVENQTAARIKEAGSIADWEKKLYESERALEKSNKAIEDNEKYLKEAETATDHCATSIDAMGKEVKDTAENIEDANKKTSVFGSVVKANLTSAAIISGVKKLGETAKEATKYVVDIGSSFEAAMSEVIAISGASGDEIEALTEKAKELGAETKFSASEAADALKYMSLAGWSTADMLSGIDGILSLAAASGMELASASDMVTDYLSAFNMKASEAAKMADMLAYAQANSNTTAEQLGEAYGNSAAILNTAGQDIETVTALLEGMANQGLKGSEAGTALGSIMTQITQKMKDGKIAIGDTNVEVADSEGNFRDLTDILIDVDSALEGMGTQQRSAALASTFNKTALSGLNLVLNEGIDKIADYEEELRNSSGAAKEMSDIMQDNLKGDLDEASSALEGLGIAAYDYVDGPVRGVVQGVTGIINGITDAITPQKSEIETFVGDIKTSNDEIQAMLDNASQVISNADVDVSKYEAYKQTITKLNELENASELQKYELRQAVNDLAGEIPELAAAWDDETERINLSKGAIEDLIDQQIAYARETAASLALQETYNAKIAADANKLKIDSSVKDLKERIEATRKLNEETEDFKNGGYGDHYVELLELEVALEDLTKEQKEANEAAEEAGKEYENLQSYVEEAAKAEEEASKKVAEHAGELDNLAGSAEDAANAAGTLGDATEKSTEKIAASAEAAKTAAQAMVETYHGYVDEIKADLQNKVSLFDKFDGGEDLTTEKINENLKSQAEGIKAYQENLEKVRAMTDENGKAIFSPELMAEIEAGGLDLANVLSHIVYTWENEGEYGAEQVKSIAYQWLENLDMTEGMAEVGAANKLAYEAAMGELGSSDADFTALSDAVNQAVESAADGWSGLAESTRTALEDAITAAKNCGVQIPEGLTEGIASGEVSAEDAIAKLNGAIQGSFDGLAEIAKESGVTGVEELIAGIEAGEQDVTEAYNALLALMSSQTGTNQMNQKGQEEGAEYVAGIESSADAAGEAAESVAQSAADALDQKQSEFQDVGTASADAYVNGLKAAVGKASQAAGDIARAARNALNAYQSSFQSAGYNVSAGVAVGIRNGQSGAVEAARNMARAALQAAKNELDIHSPSRKFRKEVGQNISESTAFGIKDKASLAGKAAAKMSNKVYTNATSWLAKYKKRQQISLADEKWYWLQVVGHTKKGTSAYNKAIKKIESLTFDGTGLSANDATKATKKIASNFGVSRTTGSGKKKKTKDAETYYSEVYSAAEKYLSNQQVLNDWSLQQELAYWNTVKLQLKEGSQAWYDATKQINSLQADIAAAEAKAAEEKVKTHANVQKDILDKYKVYYKVSAKAEMDYWNLARQQFKKGTDERIEADQNYLKACQEYYDQRKELDEEYAENSKDINEDLSKNIQDLQDAYHDAVQSRKQDILSSMNLFESWDASGYDSDTLLYNLKTQVAGLALWEQQLEELGKKGLSDALMEELSAMGPDAAANIYSLNQMSAEQLDEYNKLWEQKNTLAHSQALKDNEDLLKETNSEIINLRTEAQAELNALNADYRAALQELNTGISSELRNLVNKAGSIGEEAVSSLIAGIGKEATSVDAYNSTTQVVNQISSQLGTLKQEGKTIGASALDGLLAAMRDNDKINSASKQVIQSIKKAMEEEAEIHSPARLFRRETGPQIPAGVALGMEDGTEVAVKSAQEMMQETLAAAQEEMRRQQAALQEQTGTLSYAGIARLNRLTEQYPQQAPVVNVDNNGVMAAMNQVSAGIQTLIDLIKNAQMVMDTGVVAAELQPLISQESAAATVRRNRGNRR